MTSVVDTSVKNFNSEMSGAPVLQCQSGSFVALATACLVTGFDLKAATSLTVAAGVATLAYSGGHSAELHSVILVEGVTGALAAALNGEQKVTYKSDTEIKFATAAANGAAAGAVTFKMAPLGWTLAYSGANKAAFRSSDPMGNGHYLYVDDTDAMDVRVQGFEAMSELGVGTGKFPLASQIQGPTPEKGGYWSKGSTPNTNPVGWVFFGDSRWMMYGAKNYHSNFAAGDAQRQRYGLVHLRGFGDPLATRPSGDPYGTVLAAGWNTNHAAQQYGGSLTINDQGYGALFTARGFAGLGGCELNDSYTYSFPAGTDTLSGTATNLHGNFPSPVDGSLRMSGRYLRRRGSETGDFPVRADIPGVAYVPQGQVFRNLPPKSLVPGSGRWQGRWLLAVGIGGQGTDFGSSPDAAGICLVDITGPWR